VSNFKKNNVLKGKETQKSKIGVISLLPDYAEGGPWMGRHQILSRMSAHFNVIWINPAEEWRRLWLYRDESLKNIKTGFHTHPSQMEIFTPGKFLPKFYSPNFLSNYFERLRLYFARKRLKSLGCEKIILYLTRPDHYRSLDLCKFDLSCYHIFDDYSFSDIKGVPNPIEMDLISRCDLPIFSSKIMMNEKGGLNINSIYLPNGVDVEQFSALKSEPADLSCIPHPRIGYSGVIKKQLNLPLLLRLAIARPCWNFVFVGPIMNVSGNESEIRHLQSLANVYFLGNKHSSDLPAYIQHFDVGLMCYMKNNYTRYITPLKLNEYMASRIPIVATNLEPLKDFESCIYLLENDQEWLDAIELCINMDSNVTIKMSNMPNVVKKYDWDSLVLELCNMISSRLR